MNNIEELTQKFIAAFDAWAVDEELFGKTWHAMLEARDVLLKAQAE